MVFRGAKRKRVIWFERSAAPWGGSQSRRRGTFDGTHESPQRVAPYYGPVQIGGTDAYAVTA